MSGFRHPFLLLFLLAMITIFSRCERVEHRGDEYLTHLDFNHPETHLFSHQKVVAPPGDDTVITVDMSRFLSNGNRPEFVGTDGNTHLLIHDDSPHWTTTAIDAQSVNVVDITLGVGQSPLARTSIPPASGPDRERAVSLSFSWKLAEQRVFPPYQSLTHSITINTNEWKTCRFVLGESPFWQGTISGISLATQDTDQAVFISSISFSRQSRGADPVPDEKRFRFHGKSRSGFLVPLPSSYEHELLLPENARLEFGLCLINHSGKPLTGPIHVSISSMGWLSGTTLFERTYREGLELRQNEWLDIGVNLSDVMKKRIRLRWRFSGTLSDAGNLPHVYLALSSPYVRSIGAVSTSDRRVMLISIDTLRADHLGCYGYPIATSPYIDLLSKQSSLCQQAVTPFPSTAPAHTSLFTGLYPLQHKVFRQKKKLDFFTATFTEFFRQRGYFTGAVTGNGFVSSSNRLDKGFIVFDEGNERIDSLTDSFLPMLLNVHDSPFFLFYHTYEVHAPYYYHGPLSDYYCEHYSPDIHEHGVFRSSLLSLDDPKVNEMRTGLYDSGIRVTDAMLGRLFGTLSGLGIWNETLLVFLSDHGEHLGEQDLVGHGNSVYSPNIEVPLIVRFPGPRQPGRIIPHGINLIDVAPTVMASLGFKHEFCQPGRDLTPLFRNARGIDDEVFVYLEEKQKKRTQSQERGIRSMNEQQAGSDRNEKFALLTPEFKFIQSSPDRHVELFRLPSRETSADNEAEKFPEQVQWFTDKLRHMLDQYGQDHDEAAAVEGESSFDPYTEEKLRALGYIL